MLADQFTLEKCRKCKANAKITATVADHLFVELFPPYKGDFLRQRLSTPRHEIPREIN